MLHKPIYSRNYTNASVRVHIGCVCECSRKYFLKSLYSDGARAQAHDRNRIHIQWKAGEKEQENIIIVVVVVKFTDRQHEFTLNTHQILNTQFFEQ